MVCESEMVGVQFERAPGSWAAAHRSHPDPCYCLTFTQHLVFQRALNSLSLAIPHTKAERQVRCPHDEAEKIRQRGF